MDDYRLKPGPKPAPPQPDEAEATFSKWWLEKGVTHFFTGEKQMVREAFIAGYRMAKRGKV